MTLCFAIGDAPLEQVYRKSVEAEAASSQTRYYAGRSLKNSPIFSRSGRFVRRAKLWPDIVVRLDGATDQGSVDRPLCKTRYASCVIARGPRRLVGRGHHRTAKILALAHAPTSGANASTVP